MVARYLLVACLMLVCIGCDRSQPEALGTLEWDRVNGRAVASEVITKVYVEQGTFVKKGTPLIQLDDRKILAEIEELKAQLNQAVWALKEREAGPRQETIAEAKARVDAAEATVNNSRQIYNRRKVLFTNDYTAKEHLDIANNNYLNAKSRLKEQQEILKELLAGTRVEQIEQSRAQVSGLEARLQYAILKHEEYTVTASRAGWIDSFPFKLGDRPPLQGVVSTVLAGSSPWARVYIPEPNRSAMEPGQSYMLLVDGQPQPYKTTLRTISSEASFTPYYALSEKDRSRLSYVAELDLVESRAKTLTAGTPVQLLLENK